MIIAEIDVPASVSRMKAPRTDALWERRASIHTTYKEYISYDPPSPPALSPAVMPPYRICWPLADQYSAAAPSKHTGAFAVARLLGLRSFSAQRQWLRRRPRPGVSVIGGSRSMSFHPSVCRPI